MCGIAGRVGLLPPNYDIIPLVGDSLRHRGPDGEGAFNKDRVSFYHSRLSILDLSDAGTQPMYEEAAGIAVTFNGEIYNFRELRADLIKRGYHFYSDSDTEVLLKGYIEFGKSFFSRLNGIFAFALYDERNSRVFLGRDRCGTKPLYYRVESGGLWFSSEIRTLKRLCPDIAKRSDWRQLFLAFGFIPEPLTMFDSVFVVPKGEALEYDLNNGVVNRYRFVDEDSEDFEFGGNLIQTVKDVVTRSVKRNLISDAPIGVFLSGGLDSSIIATLADQMKEGPLTTLSVNFGDGELDEGPYQRAVLEKLHDQNHVSTTVDSDSFFEGVEDFFSIVDSPSCDGLNTFFVARAAREVGLKSVLSGVGADELFGGYPSFNRMHYASAGRAIPRSVARLFGRSKLNIISRLSCFEYPRPICDYFLIRGFYNTQQIASILEISSSSVKKTVGEVDLGISCNVFDGNYAAALETEIYMLNQLLRDSDVMGMANSLEIRVPFLDNEIFKLLSLVPVNQKFNPRNFKYLLKEAFELQIPSEVLRRSKQGFVFPFDHWLRQRPDWILSRLPSNRIICELIDRFLRKELHWSKIWALLVLHHFDETF